MAAKSIKSKTKKHLKRMLSHNPNIHTTNQILPEKSKKQIHRSTNINQNRARLTLNTLIHPLLYKEARQLSSFMYLRIKLSLPNRNLCKKSCLVHVLLKFKTNKKNHSKIRMSKFNKLN